MDNKVRKKKELSSWQIAIWHFVMIAVLNGFVVIAFLFISANIFEKGGLILYWVLYQLVQSVQTGITFTFAVTWIMGMLLLSCISIFTSSKIINNYYIVKNKKEVVKNVTIIYVILLLLGLTGVLLRENVVNNLVMNLTTMPVGVLFVYLLSNKFIKQD